MRECIKRLRRMGFKAFDARQIYNLFKCYFDIKQLNDFISDLEAKDYVAKIQS